MGTGLFIARRYLFARKSHNVINVISAISVAGLAIGTAAMVLILSVYNGFNSIVESNLTDFDPDVLIVRSGKGTYFRPSEFEAFDLLKKDTSVLSSGSRLEINVFASYQGEQGVAVAKGIEDSALWKGEIPLASVGSSLAVRMGISPYILDGLDLYYLDKDRNPSPLNPTGCLNKVRVFPTGILSVNSSIDDRTILVPLESVQKLVGSDVVNGVEISLSDPTSSEVRRFIDNWSPVFGDDFILQDRYAQHPELYKMLKVEKAVVFLILIFVVIIVAFNILSCQSMLKVEKSEDMFALAAMGAGPDALRRIFFLEALLTSLLGMAIGLAAGIALALLQQHFGFVKLPGGFVVDSYPVLLKLSDVLVTAVSVGLIGFLVAFFSSRRYE